MRQNELFSVHALNEKYACSKDWIPNTHTLISDNPTLEYFKFSRFQIAFKTRNDDTD